MYNDSTRLQPVATSKERDGTKNNGEDPGLVFSVIPAVGSGNDSVRTDQGTSTDTGACDVSVLSKKTSLQKSEKQ